MYKVLVTNDDGIEAIGIKHLVDALNGMAEIYVVAPDRERSAVGHGITVREGLKIREFSFYGRKCNAWTVNGTPADCVKVAFEIIMKQKPDLVISGINVGLNLGKDIYYSGTVSGAREGVILGVPGIAISYDNYYNPSDFGDVEKIVRPILEEIKIHEIPQRTLININIPALKYEEIKGIRVTPLSLDFYKDKFHLRSSHSAEEIEYWVDRDYNIKRELKDDDYHMIDAGYVTLTPVKIDSTHYEELEKMREWNVVKNARKCYNVNI